jgi:hypothetical protein
MKYLAVHTYNPSYLGVREQEDQGLKPVQVKILNTKEWQSGSSGNMPA